MESSSRTLQSSNDSKLLLEKLRNDQKKYHEGSFEWTDIQSKMDQIIAQNLLRYVNNLQ